MLDRSPFWSEAPASLSGPGLTVRVLPPIPQLLVSGDLDGFLARHTLPPAGGLLTLATGSRYALRLARARMLVVGLDLPPEAAGWADGCATTPMTGALAVVEITGPDALALFARGTAVDPRAASPSAALIFAGITLIACRHGDALRLHLDRGLLPYLMAWIGATDLVTP